MDSTTGVPLARSQRLVIEEVGDELLVYDLDTDQAHCLGLKAATVWRKCDGRTKVADITAELKLSADEVNQAIDELHGCGLLVAPAVPSGGLSRRDFGFRVAKVGAAAVAVPLIVSIKAPTAEAGDSACQLITTNGPGCGRCGSNKNCCCCVVKGTTGSVKLCANNQLDCTAQAAKLPGSPAGNCSTDPGDRNF